jgi:hypothetical protein
MTTKTTKLKKAFSTLFIMLIISAFTPKTEWKELLDKNLSQWDTYLSYKHKNDYKGEIPKDENGKEIAPVGYNKSQDVFTVVEQNDGPVLKISGEYYGCIITKQEYKNYHLKIQVKWGDKKWEPRTAKLKDSGVLYHSVGECGVDYWRSWMLGQELQVMEGHMGDYWSIANSAIDVKAFLPEGDMMNAVASTSQKFISIGTGTELSGFCLRSADYESPMNEWTTIELICFEGKSLHIVNGKLVMVLQNSRYIENGKSIPLIKGKIQIQSEAAEVYYKDIKLKEITTMPKEYIGYFK